MRLNCNNNLIIITGQTATGKTKLALQLAKQYQGDLINADSRQIYQKLDIITGKEKPKNTNIYLYDIVDPKENFSSFDYVKYAIPIIKKILKKGRTPIIVGGSYFYLYHLLYKVETDNIPPNWKLRKSLTDKSTNELQSMVKKINPQLFNQLNQSDRNNPQRLIRKIEILQSNQTPPPQILPRRLDLGCKLGLSEIKITYIGLRFDNKKNLIKVIRQRISERLEAGAIDEVKNLLSLGYLKSDPGLQTIGYQQLIQFVWGKITKKQAIDEWTNKEIQYAKRQYTFMKKDSNISWKKI